MEAEIASPHAWEASRLAISERIARKDRNQVLIALMRRALDYTSDLGGTTLLGMMHPAFRVVFKRAGFNVRQFGKTKEQRDGAICVLRLDFPSKVSTTDTMFAETTWVDVVELCHDVASPS